MRATAMMLLRGGQGYCGVLFEVVLWISFWSFRCFGRGMLLNKMMILLRFFFEMVLISSEFGAV